jgi:hypothetical protein
MKPRSYYLLFLGLLVGFLTMDYFLNQKIIQLKSKTSTTAKNLNNADSITKPEITVAAVEKTPVEESALDSVQQFKSEFRQEVSQIGRVQTDTEAVENRLQAVARQMEPEHRNYLKMILNSEKSNGDERAMAIELLTRNQTPEAAEILKNYSLSDSTTGNLKSGEDIIFKAQAIEGLAGYQDRELAISYLNEIGQKTNYSFLQDRVRRAQSALKNEGPAIETQDLEALRKIVK